MSDFKPSALRREAMKGGIIKKEKMENHHFWMIFIVALIAGAAIAMTVSSSMTGNAINLFSKTPTATITPASDAITLLKNSIVFHVYPGNTNTSNVTTTCNDVCAERNGTCVDAEVEETGQNNLRPVECSYAVNSRQDVYCRCAGSSVMRRTAYETYAMNEIDAWVIKTYGSLANVPAGTLIKRDSTQGKLVKSAGTGIKAIGTASSDDPRNIPLAYTPGSGVGGACAMYTRNEPYDEYLHRYTALHWTGNYWDLVRYDLVWNW